MRVVWLGLVVGLLAGCTGEVVQPPVASGPTPESSVPMEGFRGCLQQRGIRLPEDERDDERMLPAVEACAPLLGPNEAVRIPVVEGSEFLACLASHGVKPPPAGEWMRIHRAEDPVMDAALKSC
ncbi:hypothetical protein DMH08_32970 [Actinomadura sp. WAC 06369]|nr:hypothetical protein DMH08_32970 [Actinomadura sp. WAC 06369]